MLATESPTPEPMSRSGGEARKDDVYEEILAGVTKPSRYLGCEVNAVRKDLSEVDVRVALTYPDMYDLGLANLGVLILYSVLNHQPGVWAERAYAPAPDLEERLRARGLPLFSVESKTPLHQFHCIGFTLQYELNYTNIINMLDLGGVPPRVEDRARHHPLVIAGGPCVFNPEPLADFIDGFVIGDGEDVILEIVEALREARGLPRDQQLRRLAQIDGMYVPALYDMVRLPDGTLVPPMAAQKIRKRTVADLNASPFPTDYIVPFTEQAHDRVSLEVLRGCTQGCRFCQAGMVTRPARERNLQVLQHLETETFRKTGYEEVALSSLSTCDYSKVKSLVDQSVRIARDWNAAVSLPSLRLDSFSVDLSDMAHSLRKTGLTFAPEAATDRMRAIINKFIPEEELIETTREVFSRGWDTVKLYFMVGLPMERDEDVLAIADLARKVLRSGREVNRRARVNLGVSTFVPKPHTPLQWDRQIDIEETLHKHRLLREPLRVFGMKFGRHDALMSYLEGILARGDRGVGKLLREAHRLGCRFDGWGDYLRWDKWQEAFERWGHDPAYQLRERQLEEPLPWDHIDVLVEKRWLIDDYERSREMAHAADCRREKCHRCGVIDHVKPQCLNMLKLSHKGRKEEAGWQRTCGAGLLEQREAQCVRFRYAKRGKMRFLSHIETVNMFIRALRRAQIPVYYTEGFHPRPKLAFATPLPTGMESECEWADVSLKEAIDPREFLIELNEALPEGFEVLEARAIPHSHTTLMRLVAGGVFEAMAPVDVTPRLVGDRLRCILREFMDSTEIVVDRRKTDGATRLVNIRPMIKSIEVFDDGWIPANGRPSICLRMCLRDYNGTQGKPTEVIRSLFQLDAEQMTRVRIRKIETFLSGRTPLGSR